jgi:hypothetical protein
LLPDRRISHLGQGGSKFADCDFELWPWHFDILTGARGFANPRAGGQTAFSHASSGVPRISARTAARHSHRVTVSHSYSGARLRTTRIKRSCFIFKMASWLHTNLSFIQTENVAKNLRGDILCAYLAEGLPCFIGFYVV